MPATETRMVPRAGDQLCLRPRALGATVALHQLQMPHRAVAVIVPAAEVEIGHRDFPVYLVELPCPPVWMLEPVSRVLRQPRRQVAREIEPRQVVEPLALAILVPFLQRLRWRVRRRQSMAAPKVRRHGSEPPLDAPSRAEPARPIDLCQFQWNRVRTHRHQMRRAQFGQLPLHPGII